MVRSRNRRRARSGGSLVAPRTLSGGYAGAAPARGFYPLRRGPPPEAGARVLRRLGPRVSPRARPRFRRGPGSGIGSSGCPAGRPAGCPARCRAVVPRAIPRLAPGLSRGLPRGRLSRGLAGDRFRGALAAPLSQSVPPPGPGVRLPRGQRLRAADPKSKSHELARCSGARPSAFSLVLAWNGAHAWDVLTHGASTATRRAGRASDVLCTRHGAEEEASKHPTVGRTRPAKSGAGCP